MTDKRRFPRKVILSNCMVKRIFLKEKLLSVRVVNYSISGLMIESDVKFRPGDAIAIHISKDMQKKASYLADICLGLVRWCSRKDGICGEFYGIGIELEMH